MEDSSTSIKIALCTIARELPPNTMVPDFSRFISEKIEKELDGTRLVNILMVGEVFLVDFCGIDNSNECYRFYRFWLEAPKDWDNLDPLGKAKYLSSTGSLRRDIMRIINTSGAQVVSEQLPYLLEEIKNSRNAGAGIYELPKETLEQVMKVMESDLK